MRREWRVRWRGEDAGRANTRIYQSEAPARRFALILEGRLAEAFPDTDPDAVACCAGGSMEPFAEGNCNCGGKTNAEVWQERHERFPRLVEGPDVESRPVGGWELAER
jgi:hypothetical protein